MGFFKPFLFFSSTPYKRLQIIISTLLKYNTYFSFVRPGIHCTAYPRPPLATALVPTDTRLAGSREQHSLLVAVFSVRGGPLTRALDETNGKSHWTRRRLCLFVNGLTYSRAHDRRKRIPTKVFIRKHKHTGRGFCRIRELFHENRIDRRRRFVYGIRVSGHDKADRVKSEPVRRKTRKYDKKKVYVKLSFYVQTRRELASIAYDRQWSVLWQL